MKCIFAGIIVVSVATATNASESPKFYVPDADDSDVPIVCVDNHGARIFYDNGETLNQGTNTYDLDEVFQRASDSGNGSHSRITPRNADAFGECDMDIDEIDF